MTPRLRVATGPADVSEADLTSAIAIARGSPRGGAETTIQRGMMLANAWPWRCPLARITVQTPDGSIEPIELSPGESLLVGRKPDAQRVLDRADRVELFTVAHSSVSSNHVLLVGDGADTRVTDLGSKNGTWLRLPARVPVQVPSGEGLALHLAWPEAAGRSDDQPEDASWTAPEDFASSVVRVLEQWLERRGLAVRVSLCRRLATHREPEHPGQIPLAVSMDLHVVPLRTMEAVWPDVLAQVWRYVLRQNDLFATEQELRQDGIILASPVMRRVYRSIIDAARRGMRVLIMGPSGAGKEALARCYHKHSGRNGAFVARNCAMMSKDFLRAELFGAERGSFTGSVQRITGAVERANAGTLFLDEIGELPSDVQPMLLRFLDSGEYERLGQFGSPCHADVRIVCATNKDLRAACAKGDFRSDLWFRLSIQVIDVPPLRDRLEDVEAYLKTFSVGRDTSAYDLLSPEAVQIVRGHAWEGNFRELANFAERLPRDAAPGCISGAQCHEALEQGSLVPVRTGRAAVPTDEGGDAWSGLAKRAAAAFCEDHADQVPRTWDDVKEYIEKYFKPLLFAYLSGVGETFAASDVRTHADRMAADRATAAKQIERYFERFTR